MPQLSSRRHEAGDGTGWEKRQSKTLINHEKSETERELGNLHRKVNLIDGNTRESRRSEVAGQNHHREQ